MKAMLLRVGIDKGFWWRPHAKRLSDDAYSPIFKDGTFEFIPKSEETRYPISELNKIRWENFETYEQIIGRAGKPISAYLPQKLWKRHPHVDPEFKTFTYGDPTTKRKALLKLDREDMLVFYAGLHPYQNEEYKEGLYIVGYFTVEEVIDFNRVPHEEIEEYLRLCPNNSHLKKKLGTHNLVVVVGDKGKSKLLEKAILISQPKKDSLGRRYFAVSEEMENRLGIEGKIQTSIPRFIRNEDNVKNLKRILGLKSKN